MRKLILLFAVFLLFSACNNQTTEPKPDAVRVIKDTFAETILRPFNERPKVEQIHVVVNTAGESFLRKQDALITGLLAEMKSKPQHFTINATQPGEVQGEQGTSIAFSPNSFISKDGREIAALVDIELKECYNTGEMLQENMSASPDAILMESRGMIFVNATCEGQVLKLKEGEQINIQFPFARHPKDRYKFFYGNEGSDGFMNWLAEQRAPLQNCFVAKEFTRPVFLFKGLEFKNYLHEALSYPEEAKRNELSAKVEVSFLIDKNGKVTDVNTRESYKIFRNEIARVLGNMPGWKPATYGGENIPAMVHVDIDFNIRRPDQVKVDFVETEASLVNTSGSCYMECGKDFKNAKSKNAHAQSFGKLGWYSCSREVQNPGQMADVIIRADAKTDVKLILKNHNAITAGQNCIGYSRFRNLPVNVEVYVMAIRFNKGQMEYSLQPLKLEKQTVVSLAWKKGDEASIQKAYRKMNVRI